MKSVMLRALSGMVADTGELGSAIERAHEYIRAPCVWKQVESKPASGEASKPGEPGLAIFTTGHYSLIESRGDRPAPELGKMTDADKIKLFDTLLANAGTYEFDGTTLTRTVQVAKNQSVVGRSMSSQIVLSGNRFVETLTTGRNKGGTFTYERVE
jgi:hypothetical protein